MDDASRGRYLLVAVAALLGLVGASFVLFAGGREPEPIMVTGGFILALAGVVAALAAVVLRAR